MARILLKIFLFLLFQQNLLAKAGNISTISPDSELENLPSFQSIPDKSQNKTILWEIESTLAHKSSQFFAQRVNEEGVLIWQQNVELTSGKNRIQNSHKMIPDGFGGVIITWEERLNGKDETDIYAQRIDSAGKKLWGEEGVLVTAATGSQITPNIASDGKGGAIIAWSDSRNDPTFLNWDIYAQRVHSSGKTLWQKEGVVISTDLKDEFIGKLVPTSNGGVNIIWNMVVTDVLGEGEGYEFYSKKLNSKGQSLTSLHSASFISLPVSETKYKLGGDIINDGQDGFLFTLIASNDDLNSSIYLQHVLPTGEAAFQGEYGKLIDDAASNIQQLSYQLDTTGHIHVGWSEKEEETIFAYNQEIESIYNPVVDSTEISLAALDNETLLIDTDSQSAGDSTLYLAVIEPDSSGIAPLDESSLQTGLEIDPDVHALSENHSETTEKELSQNIAQRVGPEELNLPADPENDKLSPMLHSSSKEINALNHTTNETSLNKGSTYPLVLNMVDKPNKLEWVKADVKLKGANLNRSARLYQSGAYLIRSPLPHPY